jgi:hypothetical protein
MRRGTAPYRQVEHRRVRRRHRPDAGHARHRGLRQPAVREELRHQPLHRQRRLLGANYLAWLIKYFGDVYFEGDYTLDPAACADETSPCLLNAIIASYNYGFGAVDTDKGIVIPNPQYVRNVRALMTECECLSF